MQRNFIRKRIKVEVAMMADKDALYCDRTSAEGSFWSVAEQIHIYLQQNGSHA